MLFHSNNTLSQLHIFSCTLSGVQMIYCCRKQTNIHGNNVLIINTTIQIKTSQLVLFFCYSQVRKQLRYCLIDCQYLYKKLPDKETRPVSQHVNGLFYFYYYKEHNASVDVCFTKVSFTKGSRIVEPDTPKDRTPSRNVTAKPEGGNLLLERAENK